MNEYLTPVEIAAALPSRIRGRKVSAATVRRWQLVGLRNGQVFLRSRLVGSVRCSTRADLEQFFDDLTTADETDRHCMAEQLNLRPVKALRANDLRHAEFEKLAAERNL